MNPTPSVLALIPARGGSKGVPRKNIRHLVGRPLIHYSCECARESRLVTRTIVSTDSREIAQAALTVGAEVPFLRPPELAADDSPTIDVVRHALDWLAQQERWLPDIVLLLQPTAPLRIVQDIDEALWHLIRSDADSIVSVCAVPLHFAPQWQLTLTRGRLSTYDGKPLSQLPSRRQELTSTCYRNGAIYAVRRSVLESAHSLYGQQCLAYMMPNERSINIDTLDDWDAAEAALIIAGLRNEAA